MGRISDKYGIINVTINTNTNTNIIIIVRAKGSAMLHFSRIISIIHMRFEGKDSGAGHSLKDSVG